MAVGAALDGVKCCYKMRLAFLPVGSDFATYGSRCCSRRGAASLHTKAGVVPAGSGIATYGGWRYSW
jgi:hypothetical protein